MKGPDLDHGARDSVDHCSRKRGERAHDLLHRGRDGIHLLCAGRLLLDFGRWTTEGESVALYVSGLASMRIRQAARILGKLGFRLTGGIMFLGGNAAVFCSRGRPRSYRPASTTGRRMGSLIIVFLAIGLNPINNTLGAEKNRSDAGPSSTRNSSPTPHHRDKTDISIDSIKEKALNNMTAGNYETAFRLLLPLTDTGDPQVQVLLALMYGQKVQFKHSKRHRSIKESNWRNVPRNKQFAINLLNESASQGYLPAMHLQAVHYLYGGLYGKDEKRGLSLLEKTARLGSQAAIINLVVYYGYAEKHALAYKWWLVSTVCSQEGIDKAMALSKRFPEIEKRSKVRGTEMAERYFDQQKIECAILEKKK